MEIKNGYPEFLDHTFFEKALRNGVNLSSVEITDLEITKATASGDNYCSEIYRSKVTFSTENLANQVIFLIVKAMSTLGPSGKILNEFNAFLKEDEMYKVNIPDITDLLRGKEVFSAKFFYSTREPLDLMVFQDLKAINFTMAERKDLLDLNHCKLVISKLAKFHAASLLKIDSILKQTDNFNFGWAKTDCNDDAFIKQWFNEGFSKLTEVVHTWPDYKDIADKLVELKKTFFAIFVEHSSIRADRLNVLNHGDLWVNNTMFKYAEDNKTPIDVIFVDYQLSSVNSLGIDYNYFMNTSPTMDVRENNYEELMDFYYEIFSETLQKLNYKNIPSFEDVKKEIVKSYSYGLFAAACILPMVLNDKPAEIVGDRLDTFLNEKAADDFRNAMYYNEKYVKAMKTILINFNKNGVLG